MITVKNVDAPTGAGICQFVSKFASTDGKRSVFVSNIDEIFPQWQRLGLECKRPAQFHPNDYADADTVIVIQGMRPEAFRKFKQSIADYDFKVITVQMPFALDPLA